MTNGDLVGIYMFFLKYDALVRATLSTFRLLVGISPIQPMPLQTRT